MITRKYRNTRECYILFGPLINNNSDHNIKYCGNKEKSNDNNRL